MTVLRLVLRRIVLLVPIVFGVVFVTFLLVRVGSIDPVVLLAGPTASPAEIADIRAKLALDQPIWWQFVTYTLSVARGDLGQSWLSGGPVLAELMLRLPATLEMVLGGALLGAIIAIPLGLACAFRPNGWLDHTVRVVTLFGFGMPTIFLGIVLIVVFFYALSLAPPPMGRLDLLLNPPPRITGSYLLDGLLARDLDVITSAAGRLALPCAAIAIVFAAPLAKQTRAIALDVLASDHIRYARACGLPPRLLRRIVWRNSAVPVVTYGATELTSLFGAAAVLELIFAWGGVSQFGLTAVLRGDFQVVQGYVLLMALIATAIFVITDVVVLWLEPRARSDAS